MARTCLWWACLLVLLACASGQSRSRPRRYSSDRGRARERRLAQEDVPREPLTLKVRMIAHGNVLMRIA
jgi:hypothetical protein